MTPGIQNFLVLSTYNTAKSMIKMDKVVSTDISHKINYHSLS